MRQSSVHRSPLVIAAVLLSIGLGAWVGAPGAAAAVPQLKTKFGMDEHGTGGRDWHVELKVGKDPRAIKQVVLYSQDCGETAYAENVPVTPDGSFVVAHPLKKGGGFRIRGQFIMPRKVSGIYELATEDCSTGERRFSAYPPGGGSRGNGSHQASGTPLGQYPDLATAPARAIAEVESLRVRTIAAASTPAFKSWAAVNRRFDPTLETPQRPLIFHMQRVKHFRDGRVLDPYKPESLVYWWPADGPPVLVAFMYRAETVKPPKFGGEIFGWHQHSKTSAPMTHVWLTHDLESATANCLPVAALERDRAGFRYAPSAHGSGPESMPCPDPSTGVPADADVAADGDQH